MPYPPPPGPPTVGFFQGIGRLIAPALPDVTNHGGEFLETDGIIPQWEPVTGSLPDQTGHGGQFLTTDGAVANWAALTDTLPSQTGHGGEFLTTDGATASWAAVTGGTTGIYANAFDIRKFGAISVDDPSTRGTHAIASANSDAIEAAIAAWVNRNTGMAFGTGGLTGGVYIPPGNWFVERPIVLPQNCLLYGDSPQTSVIIAGSATSTEPTVAQGFGGPVVFLAPLFTPSAFPTFDPPLVGAVGQTLRLRTTNPGASVFSGTNIIDDCYPWGSFLHNYAAEVCLRCFVQVTAVTSNNIAWLVGSREYFGTGAIALYVNNVSGQAQYVAMLTTCSTTTGQPVTQRITSGLYAFDATVHHLEIDYNGSLFDFYVDGVNQGNLSASGKVYKTGMEQATVGDNWAVAGEYIFQPDGGIFSIELADIARHSGIGGFTPPTSAHTADANTLWLFNADQPAPPANEQFVMAQTAVLNIGSPAATYFLPASLGAAKAQLPHSFPAPHYMRRDGYISVANRGGMEVRDLQVMTCFNNSGILVQASCRSKLENLIVFGASNMGIFLTSNDSFYGRANRIWSAADGCAICYLGEISEVETHNASVGFWGRFGVFSDVQEQPEWASYIPFVWGPAADEFSVMHVTNCANDEEGIFSYQKAACLYISGNRAVFEENTWDASTSPAGAAFLANSSGSVHIRDGFVNVNGKPGISTVNKAQGPNFGVIRCFDCRFPFENVISDIPDLVAQDNIKNRSGLTGLSTTEVLGNNLAGRFTIMAGYDHGGPTFLVPEPDGDYVVNIEYVGYEGSAPGVSPAITSYTTSADGFVATIAGDPGGTCLLSYSYTIIRVPSRPLYRDYIPSLPSSISNPLAAASLSPSGNQAVGFTLVPVGRKTFAWNETLLNEMVVQAGTAPLDQWFYVLQAGGGSGAAQRFGIIAGLGVEPSAFAGNLPYNTSNFVQDNKLYGIQNPGPHNFSFGAVNSIVAGAVTYYQFIDGGYNVSVQFVVPEQLGSEPATVWIGQDDLGGSLLASATIRNLIIDTDYRKAITIEQDAGPQAGQTECAFFGDSFTVGVGAGAAALGGWATQIAEAKYVAVPPYYYWFAANQSTTAAVTLSEFWVKWGANQSPALTAIVIMAGYRDLLAGTSGATTWGYIQEMLEGTAATAVYIPPVQNTFAWGLMAGPVTGSATYTINGITVTGTFNTDALTTVTDLANTINATPVLNGLVNAVVNPGANPICQINSIAPGYAGDYTFTADYANGSAIYPTNGFMTGGGNGRLTITPVGGSPHVFEAIFNTDASTTVNDLIALINADGVIAALVTPSNSAGVLLLTAVTPGTAANGIGTVANGVDGCSMVNAATHLTGGVNGAIGNVTTIVLVNCPPFGDAPGYTAGKNTQRGNFNTALAAYIVANPGVGLVLADAETTLWKPADHTKIDPSFLAGDNINVNDAGHAALYALINPLLP